MRGHTGAIIIIILVVSVVVVGLKACAEGIENYFKKLDEETYLIIPAERKRATGSATADSPAPGDRAQLGGGYAVKWPHVLRLAFSSRFSPRYRRNLA